MDKPPDWSDIKGLEIPKRGLEVAATGNHGTLLIGCHGSGKTLLAHGVTTLLPESAGHEAEKAPLERPEFVYLNQDSSGESIKATVADIVCGETSGVLFLDDVIELPATAQAMLAEALESHPATAGSWLLIAATLPCPCGHRDDPGHACVCSPAQIRQFLKRLSGPLLDRIDLHLEVPRLSPQKVMSQTPGEDSATVRERVIAARRKQRIRFGSDGIISNAQMQAKQLRDCHLDSAARTLLITAAQQFSLSAASHDHILRVARTIADLDGSKIVQLHHVAEAINYRMFNQ